MLPFGMDPLLPPQGIDGACQGRPAIATAEHLCSLTGLTFHCHRNALMLPVRVATAAHGCSLLGMTSNCHCRALMLYVRIDLSLPQQCPDS